MDSAEFKTTVRQSLVGYWRWVADGRRKEQHYYDPYHSFRLRPRGGSLFVSHPDV